MRLSIFILLLVVVLMVILSKARKIVGEGQRLLVFRLGKFFDARGPGLHFLVPFIDQARLINLQSEVPEWRALSETQLVDRIVGQAAGQSALDAWVKNGRKPIIPGKH